MIFVFDGTFDGLLTSIHDGMKGCRPNAVRSEEHVEAGLFDELIATVTDPDVSLRVANGIRQRLGAGTLQTLNYAFLSEDPDISDHIFRFLEQAFRGRCTLDTVGNPDALAVSRTSRKVSRQRHSYLGLLRFQEMDGLLYAAFEPGYDLLETLPEHFMTRLPDERLVIQDRRRRKLTLCRNNSWAMIAEEGLQLELPALILDDPYTKLWTTFSHSIAVQSRNNPSLQRSRMPKKRWDYLPEMQCEK